MKLGELLIALSVIRESDITETIELSAQIGLPLGGSFCFGGHLTDQELFSALELQELMERTKLSLADAARAFAIVRQEGFSLYDALQQVGFSNT